MGSTGRNNSKSSIGSNGGQTETRDLPGQTWKKPQDLSEREGEERGILGLPICIVVYQ